VIDLRSLAPLDVATIARSAGRTGRLLTLEEGQLTCGVGAEIAFQIREKIGPIRLARIGALPAPVSSNPVLEAACLPDADRVIAAVRDMLNP
jgi:pyruvate/2-oxoglutarate/acetoin dehydrogenase E1 component